MDQSQILVFKLTEGEFPVTNLDHRSVSSFIADLRDLNEDLLLQVKEKLLNFDKSIDVNDGSFVIVSSISFDDKLNIVPTMQEAYDFIEMEDIERQLNFK